MSHWNYRVLRTEAIGIPVFKVVEVYYNKRGEPDAWVDCTDTILKWDNYDDLKGTVTRILPAFDKPVLTAVDHKLVPYIPAEKG